MADLVLELGTEEIPARFCGPARTALRQSAIQSISDWGFDRDALEIPDGLGTPRRLVLIIRGLPDGQADTTRTVTGPPWDRAFDDDGQPTQAGAGFASKNGLDPGQLEQIDTDRGPVAGFTQTVTGQPTRDLLAAAIPEWVSAIPFGKNMRWEPSGFRFARPIRWLVATLDGAILATEVAGIKAGNQSRGHRFAGDAFPVAGPDGYLEAIRAQSVLVGVQQRRDRIRAEGDRITGEARLTVDWDAHNDLLDEVIDLVEWPNPMLGSFDPDFLVLPDFVLTAPMKDHQKYFPVLDADGQMAARFLFVSNQPDDPAGHIVKGNEKVLSARLADARFFWDQDLKKKLSEHAGALARITWQDGLGTLDDLRQRVSQLALKLGTQDAAATISQAGQLYLADLGTQMVYEFPEVQGRIGQTYATRPDNDAVSDAVGTAIVEAHQPAGADDELPQSDAGRALSMAHRIDLIVGNLIAGHVVKGSQDPYGMRRAAAGIFRILEQTTDSQLDLASACAAAIQQFKDADYATVEIPSGIEATLDEFWSARLQAYLESTSDQPADRIAAALAATGIEPRAARSRLQAMADYFADDAAAEKFLDTYKRFRNIAKDADPFQPGDLRSWNDDETTFFAEALAELNGTLIDKLGQASASGGPATAAIQELAGFIPVADRMFDEVRINVDDPTVTEQRQRLVATARRVFDLFADFNLIIGDGQ